MKSNCIFFLLTLVLFLPVALSAQPAEKCYMRKGNSLFQAKKYPEAEVNYRKALELVPTNARTRYNLGNSLLSQHKPKDAMKQYEEAAKTEKNPFFKAAIYHNMGVILQSQKQFGPAIDCYKESLRNYPTDDRTRYNLALCQYQLKKNPNKQKQQNKKQKQQKKDNKKNQNNQKNQQQQQKNQNNQQKQKNQMSKENADQMLRAAMMEENRTQQKVRKAMQQRRQRNVEQNW